MRDRAPIPAAGSLPRRGRPDNRRRFLRLLALAAVALLSVAAAALASGAAFIGPFNAVTTLSSTVPANGDINPYGIATVPRSTGNLVAGDILISNFNAASNFQGTGTTIDELAPVPTAGSAHTFATIDPAHLPGPCPGGVGLTTALSVLPTGYVVVGSLPTSDGKADTAQAGCLLVLNSRGQVVETIAGGLIDGPWDMTAVSRGAITTLFVTSVLNDNVSATQADNATVVRIRLLTLPGRVPITLDEDVVGTGFPARTDPNALVIGPTGLALGARDTLYVADTLGNRIAAIPFALERPFPARDGGLTVSAAGALMGPLGLALAPNGDILTANANDGNIVETAPGGTQVAVKTADATIGAGTLFGLAVAPGANGVYFVDDGDNSLRLLEQP